jgi:YD repeat-containing protein
LSNHNLLTKLWLDKIIYRRTTIFVNAVKAKKLKEDFMELKKTAIKFLKVVMPLILVMSYAMPVLASGMVNILNAPGDTGQNEITKFSEPKLTTASIMQGSGVEGDPYLIATIDDLKSVNSNLTAHYKLIADIDLNNEEWSPLGKVFTGTFQGTFDGGMHKIKNLLIKNSTDYLYCGFFGFAENAIIKNVIIENVDIELADRDIGALVGACSDSTIINCAIIGTGKVRVASGVNRACGGLIGRGGSNLNIIQCYTSINVENGKYTGGIIGEGSGVSSSPTIMKNCLTSGDIQGIKGEDSYYGGLAGNYHGQIENCLFIGTSVRTQRLAGLAIPLPVNSYFDKTKAVDGNNYIEGSQSKTTEELMDPALYAGWDTDVWDFTSGYPSIKVFANIEDTPPDTPDNPTTSTEAIYKYDALGRLIEVIYSSGDKIVYTYDPAGNITSVKKVLAV